MNILFVCLGNICRSPMAAGAMKQLYKEQGLSGTVDSAGTEDWNTGSTADQRAIQTALENGIDIREHRARQIRREDFERFDLLVVMDRNNENKLSKLAPSGMQSKIRRILEFTEDPDGDIPDPYHGGEEHFRKTFQAIRQGCNGIAKALSTEDLY